MLCVYVPAAAICCFTLLLSAQFQTILETLQGTKDSIKVRLFPGRVFGFSTRLSAQDAKDWIAAHAANASAIRAAIMERASEPTLAFSHKLHLLYLVNDVLFHAVSPGTVCASAIMFVPVLFSAALYCSQADVERGLVACFQAKLAQLLSLLVAASGSEFEPSAHTGNVEILSKIVKLWGSRSVFPPAAIAAMEAAVGCVTNEAPMPVAAIAAALTAAEVAKSLNISAKPAAVPLVGNAGVSGNLEDMQVRRVFVAGRLLLSASGFAALLCCRWG